MRRRDFITLLAGAAGAWTCADTFAAQKSPKARIGYLSLGSGKVIDVLASPTPIECCVDPECKSTRHDAYQNTKCWWWGDFNALGWREGENLHLDARFGNRDPASLPRLAAELVALRPDVLTAPGTPETKALQAVTKDIPIVFMTSSDPVGLGLVDSINRPGRNTTGISLSPQILWGKRIELLVDLLGHQPVKVAWLSNPDNPATKLISAALMQSAEKMGIKLEPLEIREPGDLDRVFAAMVSCDAVLIQFDPITFNLRWQVAALAARHQLLAIYDNRDCVTAGGLISYGADLKESFRLGGSLVDRILRGAQAKDLPVEQPSRFQLVINLNAAKAIGLTIPSSLLARADEVIE